MRWNMVPSERLELRPLVQARIGTHLVDDGEEIGVVGVVDERVPFEIVMTKQATVHQASLVAETKLYKVYAVRWNVLAGMHGEGLWLEPAERPKRGVVAIPDADWTPEQLVGVEPERGGLDQREAVGLRGIVGEAVREGDLILAREIGGGHVRRFLRLGEKRIELGLLIRRHRGGRQGRSIRLLGLIFQCRETRGGEDREERDGAQAKQRRAHVGFPFRGGSNRRARHCA